MAQILVRNLSQRVVQKLKARAKRRGRSLQAEVKEVLEREAALFAMSPSIGPTADMAAFKRRILEIRRKFKGRKFPDSVALIREDRDR